MGKISDDIRRRFDVSPETEYVTFTRYGCDKMRELADRIDNEMVELPKDADGRPWHVGDRCVAHDRLTCARWHGKIIELQLCENDGFIAQVLLDKRPRAVRFNTRDITRPDSLERIADEPEAAKGWRDQRGEYNCNVSSVSTQTLGDWADRIRKLAEKEDK